MRPGGTAPRQRLLQLAVLETQVNRVGGEGPVRAARLRGPKRLHPVDLAARETELDTRADERIGSRAARVFSLHARLADEDAEALRLVQGRLLGARRQVAVAAGCLALSRRRID